ncbi:sigma 54-interacting transcriptional regulator [Candidatus Uabimicrobium amorphum]|uniref:Sigma-54-dependent Fis family transcriptional regulator n=1 Tax=Uabimicrobium amorphum TaxID=2596890 RepID=A0A5S9F7G5_UABAM|nr:sigma-54 dependent transcriptional regulator [Candidatus Uabimicrobium amorphum]BBM87699.1 sigma-54-dependent Fis family transcriptional regulator [Candidatus Uabimicrobium amorphum]
MKENNCGSLSLLYSNSKVTFDLLQSTTKNQKMRDVLDKACALSKLPDPLLIMGETGVGKNILAQAIHNTKKRKAFFEVTCSGIAENLFESEIFGHEKGAFTGANTRREGLALAANGGTLFLDEIGEISLQLQAKLLRLIEQKKFYPVGSDQAVSSDIHIICATNKQLEELRDPKIFRSDLFYRMPLVVEVPPLRERQEDLLHLIGLFFNRYSQEIQRDFVMSEDVIQILHRYSWPGNIRELKFAIKMALYSAIKDKEIKMEHLPAWIQAPASSGQIMSLKQVEQKHIKHVLDLTRGDKTQAAKILGIGRNTLYRKLQENGIESVEDES